MSAKTPPAISFLVDHVFLPRKLPGEESDSLWQEEQDLLQRFTKVIEGSEYSRFVGKPVTSLFTAWNNIQGTGSPTPEKISQALQNLQRGEMFGLYVREQGAGLLIVPESKFPQKITACTFPSALPIATIMSAPYDVIGSYPEQAIWIPSSDLLKSKAFASHLITFVENVFSDTEKIAIPENGRQHKILDPPDTLYVSDLIVSILCDESSTPNDDFPKICKKVRDHVQTTGENSKGQPWRRSRMWMTIKVILQLSLVKALGQEEGLLMYKILLAEFMRQLCGEASQVPNFEIDRGIHMIRKLARRDDKIRLQFERSKALVAKYSTVWSQLHFNVTEMVTTFSNCMETRWEAIKATVVELPNLKITTTDTKHRLPMIPADANANIRATISAEPPTCPLRHRLTANTIPVFNASLKKLGSNPSDEYLGNFLSDFESWILHKGGTVQSGRAETFRTLACEYFESAGTFYKKTKDPIGGSRMILTLLKFIQILDQHACKGIPLLLEHSSCINPAFIDTLLLPSKFELQVAEELGKYFKERNDNATPTFLGVVDEPMVTEKSFTVRYAQGNSEMCSLIESILSDAEYDINRKTGEVQGARGVLKHHRNTRKRKLDCDCLDEYGVEIYVRPLPETSHSRFAIAFELLAPEEIICLRDVLTLFRAQVCAAKEHEESKEARKWTWTNFWQLTSRLRRAVAPIHFQLGGTRILTKRNGNPEYASDASFIETNIQNCTYAGWYENTCDVKKWCVLSVEPKSLYELAGLQWTLESTNHNENQVLARLNNCPGKMPLEEFKAFGSLRAGHRLQLRNILYALVVKSLSLKEESVFALICQSIWEAGPSNGYWTRESHQCLLDLGFEEELWKELEKVLETCKENWTGAFTLMIVIVLTCRIIEFGENLSRTKPRAVKLLAKCRLTAIQWIQRIDELKAKELSKEGITNLQLKSLDAALCLCNTYDLTDTDDAVNSGEDFANWMLGMNRIYNIVNTTADLELTPNRRILVRKVRNLALRIELRLGQFKDSGLTEFVKRHWADGRDGRFGAWTQFPTPAEQIWHTTFQRGHSIVEIRVDIIRGMFLVNGAPVGYLPEAITQSQIFQRTFKNIVFEVSSSVESDVLISKPFSGGTFYSFRINHESKEVIVKERSKDNVERRLLPIGILNGIVPPLLVINHSHWLNTATNSIEFRGKHFDDFLGHPDPKFTFNLNTAQVTENRSGRKLIAFDSQSQKDVGAYLRRFELANRIHIFQQGGKKKDKEFIVELPRHSLRFKLDEGRLWNLDYQMHVCKFQGSGLSQARRQLGVENDGIGTLVGLESGIMLENKFHERKLLVPNGDVDVNKMNDSFHHQLVKVNLMTLHEPHFFVFEVDETLQQLRASGLTSWLYLAYLHATTSSPLPDPFTGLTGTESAIQILQSGHAWSCEPYKDEKCFELLMKLKMMSPVRRFHSKNHAGMMEITEWPSQFLTPVANEGLRFIVEKLAKDSQRLHELFEVDNSELLQGLCDPGSNNETLSKRAYFRYQPLCSPEESISKEFFKVIPDSKHTTIGFSGRIRNVKSTEIVDRIRLISHLGINWKHSPGNQISNLHSFLLDPGTTLNGVHDPLALASFDIQQIFKLKNLRDNWMNFYELARKVSTGNMKSEWTCLLSFLAYKGHPMNHLLILHSIAVNSMFFKKHDPPREKITREFIRSFVNPMENTFNISVITQMFFQRVVYDASTAELLAGIVQSNWDAKASAECALDDFEEVLLIPNPKLVSAVRSTLPFINEKLLQWWQNKKLDSFLTKLEITLQRLSVPAAVLLKCISPILRDLTNFQSKVRYQLDVDALFLTTDIPPRYMDIFKTGNLTSPNSERGEDDDLLIHYARILNFYAGERERVFAELQARVVNDKVAGLHRSGLVRVTMTTLLKRLILPATGPSEKMRELIGAAGVITSLEQQAARCVKFCQQGDMGRVNLMREEENLGHHGWVPVDQPLWLLFEIEMNLMIRKVQVHVANQMINPPNGEHAVMQLNMGEGKTAVIVPLLVLSLANGKNLCRVTVLRSLYKVNMSSLGANLGGLLNRRIYTFPCRRDLTISKETVETMQQIYEECKQQRGVVMTLPEYRLSFQLKGLEKCRVPENEAPALIGLQEWLYEHARDILDESDEILFAKYQLIYTIGSQLPVDGGALRWKVAQSLLKLLPKRMKELRDDKSYGETCVDAPNDLTGSPEQFTVINTQIRLLNRDAYIQLINMLANDVLDGKCPDLGLSELRADQRKAVLELLTGDLLDQATHGKILGDPEAEISGILNSQDRDIIFLLIGYLKYEILYLGLSKRWKVNYGVDEESERKMAVPFRAKDVPAKRTEFGHPDVGILLTQLSYYYSGLKDEEIEDCMDRLAVEPNRDQTYASWIQPMGERADHSVREYSGINRSNFQQRDELLYPMLRRNMHVIDFWLSKVVFPSESRVFVKKLICTPWDLVSDKFQNPVTGFSGTDDSSNLLPHTIKQRNLESLQDTNQRLRDTIVKEEQNSYNVLARGNSGGAQIISELVAHDIQVLLDPGALILEWTNEEVVQNWLQELIKAGSTKEAAIYFDEDDTIRVKNRYDFNSSTPFDLSPYKQKMEACVVYLDDVHTRGTDLKVPPGTTACVTLCAGMTRDKLVQACMRMRLLGKGHSLAFLASAEADYGIQGFRKSSKSAVEAVIEWATENSREFEKNVIPYWASSGLNFAKKRSLQEQYKLDECCQDFGENCCDDESYDLDGMYGTYRQETPLAEVIRRQAESLWSVVQEKVEDQVAKDEFQEIYGKILERCQSLVDDRYVVSHLLDEEQEKEHEQQQERENETERPGLMSPLTPEMSPQLEQFVQSGNSALLPNVGILRLPDGLKQTELNQIFPKGDWCPLNIFVTRDFIRVVKSSDTLDKYLRTPKWIMSSNSARSGNGHAKTLLFVSQFEANELFQRIKSSKVSVGLRMFTPRYRPQMATIINNPNLFITSPGSKFRIASPALLAPIFLFSGNLYFGDAEEQKEFCLFTGMVPRERTPAEAAAFMSRKIDRGFLEPTWRGKVSPEMARKCHFDKNPVHLVTKIINTRSDYFPQTSHVAKVVLDSRRVENFNI